MKKNTGFWEFYCSHGIMTEPGKHAALYPALSNTVSALCTIVQGLVIHDMWVTRYGIELPKERLAELRLRRIEQSIDRILEMNPAPLQAQRPPAERLIGCCRDFTIFLTSFLRSKGIPARARCGFEAYSSPGSYGDHWVAEYWNAAENRWVLVDAQIDQFQKDTWGIRCDVLDVPRDQFVVGGKAWQMCRSGEYDPDKFGLLDARGLWFVRGNLIRDFAALNKVETVPFLVGRPWDTWPLIHKSDDQVTETELALLDRIADLSVHGANIEEIRQVYAENPALWPPADQLFSS